MAAAKRAARCLRYMPGINGQSSNSLWSSTKSRHQPRIKPSPGPVPGEEKL